MFDWVLKAPPIYIFGYENKLKNRSIKWRRSGSYYEIRYLSKRFLGKIYSSCAISRYTIQQFTTLMQDFGINYLKCLNYEEKICIWKTIVYRTNDLVVAPWEYSFLHDITMSFAVLFRLINIYKIFTKPLPSTVLQLFV